MSRTAPPQVYDAGYADGRRDAGAIQTETSAASPQRTAGDDLYERGYVAGYLDWQDDEQQIEFGLVRRLATWIAERFSVAGSASDAAG